MVEKKSPVDDLGMGQVAGRKSGKARQGSPVGTRDSSFFPVSSQSGDILARCPWMEEKVRCRRSGDGRESVLHFVLDGVDFTVQKGDPCDQQRSKNHPNVLKVAERNNRVYPVMLEKGDEKNKAHSWVPSLEFSGYRKRLALSVFE